MLPQSPIDVADKIYKSPKMSKTPEPRRAFEATRNNPEHLYAFQATRENPKPYNVFERVHKAPSSMLSKVSSILKSLKIRKAAKTPKCAIRLKCAIKVEYNPDKAFDVATSATEFARSNGYV